MWKLKNQRRGSNLSPLRAGKQQGWDPNLKNTPAQVPVTKADQPRLLALLSLLTPEWVSSVQPQGL